VELERAEWTKRDLRLTVLSRNWLGAGQLCCQGTTTFLLRLRAPEGASRGGGERSREEVAEAPEGGWYELARWELSGGAGRRYARVSGDYNPIHLWPWTARPFGFRAPILHGFASAARAAHALVERRMGGDPAALRRMRVAFRAPLPLPSTAVLLVADGAAERWFRVAAPEGGAVYAEGTWGGASA
jgi:acyl dehydratase